MPHSPPPQRNLLGAVRALLGSWRGQRQLPARSPPVGLGVCQLPDGIGQLPRRTPVALIALDAPSAAAWFPALLADAVSAIGVFLVVPTPDWADRLLEHSALHTAHAQGRLTIWVMAPSLPLELRTHGLRTFFNELHSVGLQPHHALYVMGAENLVANLELAPLQRLGEQLRMWCLERREPVVLGFCRSPVTSSAEAPAAHAADILPLLRGLCSMTLPLVTLASGTDRFTLHFERWNATSGAIFQTSFGLQIDPQTQCLHPDGSRTQGQGQGQGQGEGQEQVLVEAPDQRAVIAIRAAVDRTPGVPQHWHIVETLDDVAVAAAQSIGATVLLDAGNITEFEERARLVHQLRLTRPHTLKIVVRETAGKLRSHSEQALLQLGANAVFYKELGFSRLLQLLQDIQTQSYSRAVNPDYGQALSAFMPTPERGYRPAPQFSRLVKDMLARTQHIGLAHSMVRLDIGPQTAHITALRACKMSRDGDLLTADRNALYLFLFACREPDIEPALQRLFDVPLALLFTAQSTDCSALGMKAMLERLDTAARQGLPEYSSLLGLSTPTPPAAQTAPVQPPASASRLSPALPHAAPTTDQADLASTVAAHAQRPSVRAQAIGQRDGAGTYPQSTS